MFTLACSENLYYIYLMASVLIAESGSTKTDWYLAGATKKPLHAKTSGINPYLQTSFEINALLSHELQLKKYKPEQVYFYGAGAGTPEKQEELKQILKAFFGSKKVEVKSDLMAACRGLSGNKKGVVAILGTGSNSCYYDGKTIKSRMPSLGYVAGDEGSGNHMGKRVLRYYAYNTFDEELKAVFEQLFGNDISAIVNNIYKKPFANRYLASFTQLLVENRGHYMVENIIEDSLSEFFHHHILKYRESWKFPIHFTGSVAYEFRDVIKDICLQNELTLGKIERSPLKGLIEFHKQ